MIRLAAVLSCLLLLNACAHTTNLAQPKADGDSASAANAVPVKTAVVRRGTLPELVAGYGSVGGGANAKANLAFAEAGRITSVRVTLGDRVRAGAILARLDPRPFETELEEARATVAAARAARSKVRLGARPQQVAETDAQLRQAKTQVEVAQSQADREAKLLALGIAARSDVDAARASLAGAQAQLEVLEQQRSAQVHPWQPDLQAADAGVAQAQSAADAARQRVAMTQLFAPFAGIVVARMHNDGESVDASMPVLELANDAAPTFTAQFIPEDAAQLRIGDAAVVTAQGLAVQMPGRVAAINPMQGDAHTVAALIRFQVPSRARSFGPGAFGKVTVRVGTRHGLIVPEPAIITDAATGAVQVFRQHDDGYEPVPITVEDRFAGWVIVVAPSLRPGDRVATQGAYELLTPRQAAKKDSD